MKTLAGVIFIVSFSIAAAFSSSYADAKADPVGEWNFNLSDSTVKGMCPMGGDSRGKLSIMKKGNGKYLLKYLHGMSCRPAKVCSLSGTCKGAECVFSNTVRVDSEGGKVTNSATLRFQGKQAKGSGKSLYSHPAMSCSWAFSLSLKK